MLIAERRDVSFFFKKIPCFLNSSIDMNLATALFTP